jgi:hypothetical protein
MGAVVIAKQSGETEQGAEEQSRNGPQHALLQLRDTWKRWKGAGARHGEKHTECALSSVL